MFARSLNENLQECMHSDVGFQKLTSLYKYFVFRSSFLASTRELVIRFLDTLFALVKILDHTFSML